MFKKMNQLLLLVGMVAIAGRANAQNPEAILGGQSDAPIRIEVFSDFQCPACRALYLETMRSVLKDYSSKDKVCVIYHEFPLQMHQYAREAARYSVASQKLGKQKWQSVIEALYTQQAQWSQTGNVEAVVASALNFEELQKVKKLMQDPAVSQAVDRDIALGQERKVKSTPTIFVSAIGNEQRVEGPITYPVLKEFFDRIVK